MDEREETDEGCPEEVEAPVLEAQETPGTVIPEALPDVHGAAEGQVQDPPRSLLPEEDREAV